jgi:YidC/Oxa1 family membrane protein insertase
MMLKIQPELDEIKNKYKGDQQKISLETMALWKKHRVSPIGGCLPLLIQIPILIALFYVVRTGFTPYEGYHLYSFLSSFDLAKVNPDFYGILNLQEVNATWLPIVVGLLQYAQMKMSLSRFSGQAPKPKSSGGIGADLQNPLLMMNKSMTYFMPIMILLMVASLPSGVGLYLGISTLFGIAQQFTVNRSTASPGIG